LRLGFDTAARSAQSLQSKLREIGRLSGRDHERLPSRADALACTARGFGVFGDGVLAHGRGRLWYHGTEAHRRKYCACAPLQHAANRRNFVVPILIFGPLSDAHFNAAVSLAFALRGGLPWLTAKEVLLPVGGGRFGGIAHVALLVRLILLGIGAPGHECHRCQLALRGTTDRRQTIRQRRRSCRRNAIPHASAPNPGWGHGHGYRRGQTDRSRVRMTR
jgi:hypothetical protein